MSFNCCARVKEVVHEKFGRCYAFRDLVQNDENPMSSLVLLIRFPIQQCDQNRVTKGDWTI